MAGRYLLSVTFFVEAREEERWLRWCFDDFAPALRLAPQLRDLCASRVEGPAGNEARTYSVLLTVDTMTALEDLERSVQHILSDQPHSDFSEASIPFISRLIELSPR